MEPAGVLDRSFDRLYRRTRRRYLEALLGGLTSWAVLVVAPLNSTLAALFFEMEWREWWGLLAATELGVIVATPFVVLLVFRRHAREVRWLHGEPGADPAAAWSSAVVNLPGTVLLGTLLYTVAIVPALGYMHSRIGLSTPGLAWWVFDSLQPIAGAGLFGYLMFERALRPAMREAFTELPTDFQPAGAGLSLRTKLLAILLLLSMFSGSFVATITLNTTNSLSRTGQLAVWGTASIGFTLTVAFALGLLVRESVLSRVEALRGAMSRVDRGEYDAHVMPLGGDELDELGRSFNQMVGRLRDHDEELRESRARIVAASDQARRQVERDLHDGAQQQLVTLRLRLGMALQAADTDPARVKALLGEARDDVSRALEELRDLAHGIYPAVLTTDGLPAALEVAAERCPLPVTLDYDDATARLAPEVEAAVYFCCVEALQNAAKHAGPDATVMVLLEDEPGGLRFQVRDNGVGYDPSALGMSAGLRNMADRIGALGGTLRVESAPGAGTVVVGSIDQGAP